jgi:hypothetical protein
VVPLRRSGPSLGRRRDGFRRASRGRAAFLIPSPLYSSGVQRAPRPQSSDIARTKTAQRLPPTQPTLRARPCRRVATGRNSLGKAQLTKIPGKTQGKKQQPLTIKPPTGADPRAGGLSLWTSIGGQAAGVSDPAMRKSRDLTIRRRRSGRPGGTGRRCPGPRP